MSWYWGWHDVRLHTFALPFYWKARLVFSYLNLKMLILDAISNKATDVRQRLSNERGLVNDARYAVMVPKYPKFPKVHIWAVLQIQK